MAANKEIKNYDFRSDTVTIPTLEMRQAMVEAVVGDDVYGEDPTVEQLETLVAQLCQKEAALFCASGCMVNQLGIRVNITTDGLEQIICDQNSHIVSWEAAAIQYHSRASVKMIQAGPNGHITAESIKKVIVNDHHDFHLCYSKLIVLENTLHGTIFPIEEMARIRELALENNLKMHLDGARLWNACIATGLSLADYCKYFDTISLCLSKGLGAPIGSVLVGSKKDIKIARHYRKLFGGGWRQAGILAAACIYAINNHWKRISEDHANAKFLGENLIKRGFKIIKPIDTNMVWVDSSPVSLPIELIEKRALEKYQIKLSDEGEPFLARLVVHIQTTREACEQLIATIDELLEQTKTKTN
eukprot:TRINITY_DN131_c2_g1_i1.p1 TRINITY_DN131_c2_g1~~TRINITY_DN131_c2_g1_i1.p1  ORF type:complete len:359 (-),score=158.70 TRINITY_DN131_c2_g1_i1:154-1230(-)